MSWIAHLQTYLKMKRYRDNTSKVYAFEEMQEMEKRLMHKIRELNASKSSSKSGSGTGLLNGEYHD